MSKPQNIFLIRHGESEGNVDRSIYLTIPDYAVKLTEIGEAQARGVADTLFSLGGYGDFQFYVSPYFRTRQTFREIRMVLESKENECGDKLCRVKHIEEPRLREQEWAGYLRPEGIDIKKIQEDRDKYSSFYYRFNGGESCADVYDRISSFLNTLWRDFNKTNYPSNVGIICHGMTMRVFLMKWLHLTVEEFELLRNPKNCEMFHLKLNNQIDKYELVGEPRRYKKHLHPYQMPLD